MPFGTRMPSLRTHPKMDRGLCLKVQARPSVCALYSISVRHPVPSRYLASARQLLSEAPSPVLRCHTATPFASIGLGLRLAKCLKIRYIRLTFKNMCRARHTPGTKRRRLNAGRFEHFLPINFFLLSGKPCFYIRRWLVMCWQNVSD